MTDFDNLSPRDAIVQERITRLWETSTRIEQKIDMIEKSTHQLQLVAAEWKGTVRGVLIAAPALGGLLGALASILMKKLVP